MKIQWLKKPKEDLRVSFRYLAERNPDAAWRLREELEKRVRILTDHPKIAPLGRVQGTRELQINGWDYVIIYRIKTTRLIQILRVLHHAQQWKKAEKRACSAMAYKRVMFNDRDFSDLPHVSTHRLRNFPGREHPLTECATVLGSA